MQRGGHEHFDHLRAAPRDVSADVTADMTVEQLADAWIDEILIDDRVKRQTVNHYTDNLHYLILPAIGDMTIHDATVGALDRYLKTPPGPILLGRSAVRAPCCRCSAWPPATVPCLPIPSATSADCRDHAR
ncbi:hypothetical protein [Actinoplanes sp. NPDC026619]|uniref:hypothetical protein n=1 Tax=Actinoplanes sp. NPDC026619 TaxID=3155798 RepID=UPI0033C6D455